MTINLPEYIAIISVLLACATLVFAIVKWLIDGKLKTQLASVVIATHLETLSRHCFQVAKDEGTWSNPEHPDYGNGQMSNNNEPEIAKPDLPNFETFEDVSRLGLKNLDRLMSLRAIPVAKDREGLRAVLDKLSERAKYPEAWKEAYPKTLLFDKALYWPKAFKPFAPKD